MKRHVAMLEIKHLIMNKEMDIRVVEYNEVSKYLALMMTAEEIKADSLHDVMLRRVKRTRKKAHDKLPFLN